MTNFNEFTKVFADMPNAFPVDQKSVEEGFKTWASFGEKFTGISIDAAAASNDVATSSTRETLDNLRNVTVVRQEPAEYGKAFNDFAQAQFEIARRTAEAFTGIARQASTDAAELITKTGEEATSKAANKTESAAKSTAQKTASAANKAA